MSRKMVIAAVAAASVVGLGSASMAAEIGFTKDALKGLVTSQTGLDDFVTNNGEGRDLQLPPQGDLISQLEKLRGDLAGNSLTVPEGTVQRGSARLAGSVDSLANSLEQQNAKLPGGKAETATRLTASLARSADALRDAPSQRVDDAANVNEELSGALLGLEKTLQRMRELDRKNVLQAGTGDILDSQLTNNKLTEVAKSVRLMSVR